LLQDIFKRTQNGLSDDATIEFQHEARI
jgi:hypothetical protein